MNTNKSVFVAIFMDPGDRLDELDVHVYADKASALTEVEVQMDVGGVDNVVWEEETVGAEHRFILYIDGDMTAIVYEKSVG